MTNTTYDQDPLFLQFQMNSKHVMHALCCCMYPCNFGLLPTLKRIQTELKYIKYHISAALISHLIDV